MKIITPIGSKARFLEMFQEVNKMKLDENVVHTAMVEGSLPDAAINELIAGKLNIGQVNNQVNGDESTVEISATDDGGASIVFTFRVNSNPTDQDGVYSVDDTTLINFKIKNPQFNLEMPEGDNTIAEVNQKYKQQMIDVVSEHVDFQSNDDIGDAEVNDSMYEDAVKFIDNVPYNKGTEQIQTNAAYADRKPTNPDVRVKAPELDSFVSEMQEYSEGSEYHYDTVDVDNVVDTSFNQILNNDDKTKYILMAKKLLGNSSVTAISQKATELFRMASIDMNEATDQDNYEDVVFLQGDEADEPLNILNNQGEDAAMEYLKQWHDTGNHMGSDSLGHGSGDQTYEKDGYTMAWNFQLNYIGLQYELAQMDNPIQEDGAFPDQMGKKFKPKNQMPKKKKQPQSVVKLSEEDDVVADTVDMNIPEDEIIEIKIENYPYYLKRVDSTHFYMGNNKEGILDGAVIPSHINQHNGRSYHDDVRSWLKGGESPYGKSYDTWDILRENDTESGNVLSGGLGDDKSPSDFDIEQIVKGIKVEMEHTNNPLIAIEIVLDHLTEDEFYYGTEDDNPEDKAQHHAEIEAGEIEDDELTDELLGFEPHNVGDDIEGGSSEHPLADILDTNADDEDLSKNNTGEKGENLAENNGLNPDMGEVNIDITGNGWIKDQAYQAVSKGMKNLQGKSTITVDGQSPQRGTNPNGGMFGGMSEDSDDFEEYLGDIGDRYQDANNNDFTVRDKVKGGVTLQGQGGEKEVSTSDLHFMKKR